MAFGDTTSFDISTACIVVEQCEAESEIPARLAALRFTGAPVAIFALPERIGLTAVTASVSPVAPVDWFAYEHAREYLGTRKQQLGPRSLTGAKSGDWQLSFLDIDPTLAGFAEEATRKTMVARFAEAVQSVAEPVRLERPGELTRLSIFVLAARILQDKLGRNAGDYRDLQRATDARALLAAADSHFPDYFSGAERCIELVGQKALETLHAGLTGKISFGNLTNDTIGYFYEHALIDSDLKRQFGVYYTPRSLATRILQRLPIEDLPLNSRNVLDGTCGSGNLLLAAHERLAKLLPARWSAAERHGYLKNSIWGIDQDPFACDVARVSLLLFSLPSGNDWRIRRADVFMADPTVEFGSRPDIIVGNPPFHEDRWTPGERTQRAARVLDRYIDWLRPGGLLGTILPITMLQNASGRRVRERLLSHVDLLEVWQLPEGAIPSSGAALAVVLARKQPENASITLGRLTRVEKATKRPMDMAGASVTDTLTYGSVHRVSQDQWRNDPDYAIESSPLDTLWQRMAKFSHLEPSAATLFNGIQPGKLARQTHFSTAEEAPDAGWRPVLYKNVNGVLQPFAINWGSQNIRFMRYPSPEVHRPRDPAHFSVPTKVVLNATRSANSNWRFYAAVDTKRLLVTENFHYAIPAPGVSVKLVAALLNSMLANAWFSSRNFQRDVNLDHLRELPLAPFTVGQVRRIEEAVDRIAAMHRTVLGEGILPELLDQLDALIFEAYGCSAADRAAIREWMGDSLRPGVSRRDRPKPVPRREEKSLPSDIWRVLGMVEHVDPENATVTLWLQGLHGTGDVAITDAMPGWLLRPDTAFWATIPRSDRAADRYEQIRWLDFEPVEFSYMSGQDLVAHLSTSRSAAE
ncbi:MAG TPA: N-6 DNA methylase [Longimicrobium sp.]|nr:N-6 DNA methylase [Longimicrobium sp.]